MFRKLTLALILLGAFLFKSPESFSFDLSRLFSADDRPAKSVIELHETHPNLKSVNSLSGSYLDEIPGTDLIGAYKLDGNAGDSTGNNGGTFHGPITTVENRYGEAGKAITFNGTSNYISTNNQYNNPGSFTVSIWFKTNTNVGGTLIGFSSLKNGVGGNRDRFIYMTSTGRLVAGVAPGRQKKYLTTSASYNDDKWHLATLKLGSGGFTLYVDGEETNSVSNVRSAENYSGYWRIGHDDLDTWPNEPSSFFFRGALDDALIYHRELSAEEVRSIYYPVIHAVVANTCFNQSTGSIIASASGGVPPYVYNINGGSYSSNNVFTSRPAGNYDIRVRDANNRVTLQSVKVGIQSLSQIPENGLIGFYKMNGNANDETGTNHGTTNGSPVLSTDRFGMAGKAYSFNGSNQHIYTANTYSNAQEFTLSIWFKTDTDRGGKLIGFARSKTGLSTQYDRHVYMNNSGQIFFGIYSGSTLTVNTEDRFNDNEWHHVLATFSSSGIHLYVDGTLRGSNVRSLVAENYTGSWRIGGDNLSGWPGSVSSNYFKGSLDEAIIYDRVVTPGEISIMYQSGDGAGNNGPVCAGTNLNLTSTSLPGASYSWTGPGGFTSTQQNPVFSYSNASAGIYTVTVTSSTGCVMNALTKVAGLTNPGQWTGNISSDWHNASNWCDGLIPTSATDVTITAGSANMPVITTTANVRNITIAPEATITTQAAGAFNISGLLTNNGTMNNSGTTVFNGSTVQTYSGVTVFNHVTINNPQGLILPDSMIVANLTIQAGSLDANEKDITVTGNWVNNSGSTAFVPGTAKVRMIGTTPQTIGGSAHTIFNVLYASSVGSTITLAQNISIRQNLIVGGIFDLGVFTTHRQTVGGTLYVNALGHLKIGGANTLPSNFTTNTFLLGSIVEYSGAGQIISGQNYGTLILSSSGGSVVKTAASTQFTTQADFIIRKGNGIGVTFTNASNLLIGKNVLLEAGAILNATNSTITVNGNWQNDGVFNGNTGKVILAGTSSSVYGTGIQNFNDLTIAGSYVTFSNHSLTLSGSFETIGQGVFTQSPGGTLTMTGDNKTIQGTGISIENLTVSGTGKITIHPSLFITGNLHVATATNSLSTIAGSTITMSGTNKTLSGAGSFSFVNLNITGSIVSSSNFTITGGLNVDGSFSATTGIAAFSGNTSLSGVANLFQVTISGTKLHLASNSNLGIAQILTINPGASLDVITSIPNTVNYNGARNQTINAITFHNLVFSNGFTKSASGPVTVIRDVEIRENTTFKSGDFTHTFLHDWINKGMFTKDAGTIKFAGSATSHISGYTDFNILTLDHADPSANVLLNDNVRTNILNMTKGTLETGSNKIEITSNRTGLGIIWGKIQRTHAFVTGTSYAFGGYYNTLTFNAPAGITTVTVQVERGAPSDFPSNASVNRWYGVEIPTGTFSSATWRLEYDDNFLNGNDETTLELWNNPAGSWAPVGSRTGADMTFNYIEKSGLTNLNGKWTLSGIVSEFVWKGSVNSDWHNALNWQTGGITATRIPNLYDVVTIGGVSFNDQPTINSVVKIKNLVFGSAKEVTLNLASGGSLTSGDISGVWNNDAIHTINLNAQTLDIQGNLILGDGNAQHAIHVNIGTGPASVSGWISLPAGAKIDFKGNGILRIGEKIVLGGGVFIAGSGTVEYNGSIKQNLAPVNYHHLTINKSAGLAEMYEATLVKGNLSILSGVLENESRLVVEGNVNIGINTILENEHIIEVGGNWLNEGTYEDVGIRTLFNGEGTQTISASTFNNITFNKPVGSLALLAGNVTINGSLLGTSGTLDIKNYHFNRTVLGGSAVMSDNATLIIGDNNAPTLFGNYFMSPKSTIIFDGTNTQVLQLPGLVYGNVIFRNAGIKQLTIPITVAGKLTIENGATLQGGSNTLTLRGDWENAGNFVPETGTVLWQGINKNISGPTVFNHVTISGTYQVHSSLTLNGLLELTSSGVVSSIAGVNYLLHGDLITKGTLNILGEGVFSGNVLQTMKLINGVTNIRTITFNGSVSPQMISTSAPQFGILNVNNTAGVNPSVGWTVLGALNVGPGALFNGGPFTHLVTGHMNNLGIITSTGNLNFLPENHVTLNFGTGFTSTGLVRLGGTGIITLAGTPVSFKNLTIENTHSSGVAPSSDWIITNNFDITEGSAMNAGTYRYFVGGDLENYGTINKETSTFIFNGIVGQEFISSSSLHHVTINKSSGELILGTDLNLDGTLKFDAGNITTGENIVFLSENGTLINASQITGWVNGKLNKFIGSGTSDKTFEIGDSQYYTPVDLEFTSITTSGGLTVSTTSGDHPQIGTSAINPERSINRYYSIYTTGLAVSTYHPRFHFVPEDVDAGVTLGNVYISAYNGSSWASDIYSEYEDPNSVRGTMLTWFGDMALGEICNMGTFIEYSKPVFCTNEGTALMMSSGTLGGVFSAESGLSLNATTGEINLSLSTPGDYVVTYFIAATSGCREFISRTAIIIGEEGLWTGKESNEWENAANWSCSGVPGEHINVIIPSGLINYPLISGIATLKDLNIQTGASVNVIGTLQLFGAMTNAGLINLTAGGLEMSGTNGQVISPLGFVNNSVENLIINNRSVIGVTLDGPLNVTGAIKSDHQGFYFHTHDYLTLKSTAQGSARVGNMTDNIITGNVTVEHYLSAHKAWRLLSVPTNTTQSIKESWQEGATSTGQDPKPGYGTQVMSNRSTWQAEGFDVYAGGGPSIKTWSNAANNWVGVTSAFNNIATDGGYLIIIRGDRKSNAFNSPVTETTLRTKGPLKIGDQPDIVLPPFGYSGVGNPYAAPVDFRKINLSEGVDSVFYAWDPFIRGNYNLGGYQTISAVNDWKPVPGGSFIYPTGMEAHNLQSGQAVLVHTTPVIAFAPHTHMIKFTEAAKADVISPERNPVNFARGASGGKNNKHLLRVTLLAVSPSGNIVADGNVAAFSPAYSNSVDGQDAIKILAGGENFGLKRDGKTLAIEARNEALSSDTLHYYMTNVAKKPYRLHFDPVNMHRANVQAYLLDNFLQTTTPVSMYDTTGIEFSVTTNAASAAPDRFKIIFRPMTPLAVKITTVKAVLNKNAIDVTWAVSVEEGIEKYEVEKSVDGNQFVKTHFAKANNRQGSMYSWKDESPVTGYQYYRIRIISQNGEVSYSEIVKILVNDPSVKISVYPNPVVDGKINVLFTNQPEGRYSLRLFNTVGQLVINKMVENKGNSSNAVLQLTDKHAKGIYRLEIQNSQGEVQTIQVIH